MSRPSGDRPRGPSAESLGVLGLAALTLWFVAVQVNVFVSANAVVAMGYFELTPGEYEELVAARPWAWVGMMGFLVLAALGWWMGSTWWPPLLVASTGIVGLQQLLFEENGSFLALLFLPITVFGAIATVIIARPFPRKVAPSSPT